MQKYFNNKNELIQEAFAPKKIINKGVLGVLEPYSPYPGITIMYKAFVPQRTFNKGAVAAMGKGTRGYGRSFDSGALQPVRVESIPGRNSYPGTGYPGTYVSITGNDWQGSLKVPRYQGRNSYPGSTGTRVEPFRRSLRRPRRSG
eukprot:3331309-Rhodomonas_salina.1